MWFEWVRMPYAQVDDPFENQKWFDGVSGAGREVGEGGDSSWVIFIVEYIGQTRGLVLHAAYPGHRALRSPGVQSRAAHGIVPGNDVQEQMSKLLRNFPTGYHRGVRSGWFPNAMRWILMASPILRGGNLIVTEQGIREGVRQVLLPLWNRPIRSWRSTPRRRARGGPNSMQRAGP